MYDDVALGRLVSRLRQDLLNLPNALRLYAEQKRLGPGDSDFDPEEQAASESFARNSVENAVYLMRALLLSAPMLKDLYSEFNKALPSCILKHERRSHELYEESQYDYVDFQAQSVVERFFDLVQRFHGTTPMGTRPISARRPTVGPQRYERFHGIDVLGVAAVGGVISNERLEIVDAICSGLGEAVAYSVDKQWILAPDKETPIKYLAFQLLKAAFPDTHPDGGITFMLPDGQYRKPDAAIPSLRLCVEFKYANDETELGQCVDGIVADMSAYGDPRYDKFRAVVFVPYSGASQDKLQSQVSHRMKKVRPHYEWRVFS
jgi:hypothetical protein